MSVAARIEGIRIREREVSERRERTGATVVRIPSPALLRRATREPQGRDREENPAGRGARARAKRTPRRVIREWWSRDTRSGTRPPKPRAGRPSETRCAPGPGVRLASLAVPGPSACVVRSGPTRPPLRVPPHAVPPPHRNRASRLPSLVSRPRRLTPSRAGRGPSARSRARRPVTRRSPIGSVSSARGTRRTRDRASRGRRRDPPGPRRSCTPVGWPRRRTPAGRPCRRRSG